MWFLSFILHTTQRRESEWSKKSGGYFVPLLSACFVVGKNAIFVAFDRQELVREKKQYTFLLHSFFEQAYQKVTERSSKAKPSQAKLSVFGLSFSAHFDDDDDDEGGRKEIENEHDRA